MTLLSQHANNTIKVLTKSSANADSDMVEQNVGKTDVGKNVPASADTDQPAKDKKTATVTVSKIEITPNGTTRATCKLKNGNNEQIIIAKNDTGETLQNGVGKNFTVRYNLMSDGKAWYCISARPA